MALGRSKVALGRSWRIVCTEFKDSKNLASLASLATLARSLRSAQPFLELGWLLGALGWLSGALGESYALKLRIRKISLRSAQPFLELEWLLGALGWLPPKSFEN